MLMKKLVTLILVLAGIVGTVSAKTIYLVNNWSKAGLHLYLYNSDTDKKAEWPGTSISEVGYLDGSTSYYKLDLESYSYFIINYSDSGDGNTKTTDLTSSDYTDGSWYQFKWDEGTVLEEYSETVYEYNFTVKTRAAWDNFYVWMWNPSNKYNLLNVVWPGKPISGTENVYTFTEYSTLSSVSLVFDQGDGQPQTCDLTATPGENKYYIAGVLASKIDDSWGLTVKTNASGYATWGDAWHAITIPSGIAYCAEDNGNGSATAHTVTNPAANTPMLIKGEANTTYHFAPASDSESLSYTNALIRGTGEELESGSGPYNYILNGDTFYAANGKIVGTNKAYLQLSVAATARALVFDDEETTGIAVVNASQKMNGEYFNLAGQRVAQPAKGLYIVNGKKVIMK